MIWNTLKSKYGYSDTEVSQIKFVVTSVISEVSKLMILGVLFTLAHHFREYVISILILLCIRTNSGGLHFNRYISCLLFSFLLLSCSILFLPSIICVSRLFMLTDLVVCIIISFMLEPVRSIYRPSNNKNLLKMCHINTFKYIFIYLVALYILPTTSALVAGFWTINLQMLQLIVANILKKGGLINETD